MRDRESKDRAAIPTVYFPRRDGQSPDPVPFLMTDEELIRFTQIDVTDVMHPSDTIARYRAKGLLRFVQVGRDYRYMLPDVIDFLYRLQGPPDRE